MPDSAYGDGPCSSLYASCSSFSVVSSSFEYESSVGTNSDYDVSSDNGAGHNPEPASENSGSSSGSDGSDGSDGSGIDGGSEGSGIDGSNRDGGGAGGSNDGSGFNSGSSGGHDGGSEGSCCLYSCDARASRGKGTRTRPTSLPLPPSCLVTEFTQFMQSSEYWNSSVCMPSSCSFSSLSSSRANTTHVPMLSKSCHAVCSYNPCTASAASIGNATPSGSRCSIVSCNLGSTAACSTMLYQTFPWEAPCRTPPRRRRCRCLCARRVCCVLL